MTRPTLYRPAPGKPSREDYPFTSPNVVPDGKGRDSDHVIALVYGNGTQNPQGGKIHLALIPKDEYAPALKAFKQDRYPILCQRNGWGKVMNVPASLLNNRAMCARCLENSESPWTRD